MPSISNFFRRKFRDAYYILFFSYILDRKTEMYFISIVHICLLSYYKQIENVMFFFVIFFFSNVS